MCAPTTAQHAAIEALENCDEPVLQMAAEYDRRRRIVLDGVQKAGLDCFEPLGAFYVFPDITPSGLDSATFCERFLYEEKVAIVPAVRLARREKGMCASAMPPPWRTS
jgi:aminotransferase